MRTSERRNIGSMLINLLAFPYVDDVKYNGDEIFIVVKFEDKDGYVLCIENDNHNNSSRIGRREDGAMIFKKVDMSRYGYVKFNIRRTNDEEIKMLFHIVEEKGVNREYILDWIWRYFLTEKFMLNKRYFDFWDYDNSLYKLSQQLTMYKQNISEDLYSKLSLTGVIAGRKGLLLEQFGRNNKWFWVVRCGGDNVLEQSDISLEDVLEDDYDIMSSICFPLSYKSLSNEVYISNKTKEKIIDSIKNDENLKTDSFNNKVQFMCECDFMLINSFFNIILKTTLSLKIVLEVFPTAGAVYHTTMLRGNVDNVLKYNTNRDLVYKFDRFYIAPGQVLKIMDWQISFLQELQEKGKLL